MPSGTFENIELYLLSLKLRTSRFCTIILLLLHNHTLTNFWPSRHIIAINNKTVLVRWNIFKSLEFLLRWHFHILVTVCSIGAKYFFKITVFPGIFVATTVLFRICRSKKISNSCKFTYIIHFFFCNNSIQGRKLFAEIR